MRRLSPLDSLKLMITIKLAIFCRPQSHLVLWMRAVCCALQTDSPWVGLKRFLAQLMNPSTHCAMLAAVNRQQSFKLVLL